MMRRGSPAGDFPQGIPKTCESLKKVDTMLHCYKLSGCRLQGEHLPGVHKK